MRESMTRARVRLLHVHTCINDSHIMYLTATLNINNDNDNDIEKPA
jgi:hypothetical protein